MFLDIKLMDVLMAAVDGECVYRLGVVSNSTTIAVVVLQEKLLQSERKVS